MTNTVIKTLQNHSTQHEILPWKQIGDKIEYNSSTDEYRCFCV